MVTKTESAFSSNTRIRFVILVGITHASINRLVVYFDQLHYVESTGAEARQDGLQSYA